VGRRRPPASPLDRDLFTTTDFYKDIALWSILAISVATALHVTGDVGRGPHQRTHHDRTAPASASWGHCEIDYPREAIVSPYPFKSAQEHYEALLAETSRKAAHGLHARASAAQLERMLQPRDLAAIHGEATGRRDAQTRLNRQWFFTSINQTSTILASDARVPKTDRADALSPVGEQRSFVAGSVLLARRIHAAVLSQAHLAMDFVTTPERLQLMASSADNSACHFNVGRTFNMSGAVRG
jgi:hypothetical protein